MPVISCLKTNFKTYAWKKVAEKCVSGKSKYLPICFQEFKAFPHIVLQFKFSSLSLCMCLTQQIGKLALGYRQVHKYINDLLS